MEEKDDKMLHTLRKIEQTYKMLDQVSANFAIFIITANIRIVKEASGND